MCKEPSSTPCCKCKFLQTTDMGGFGNWYKCKAAKVPTHDPIEGTSYRYMDLPDARGNQQECHLFMPNIRTRVRQWFTNKIVIKQVEVTNEK